MLDTPGQVDLSLFLPSSDAIIIDPRRGLAVPPDTERGENILDDQHQLIHLKAYDDKLVFLALNSAVPNPEQPRSFFEEEKMAALRETIGEKGQSNPIQVVPMLAADGTVSFLIIDGERRFRVLTELGAEYIKALVRYFPTAHEVFEESLVLNVSPQDHTPIELAHAYKRMLDHYEKTEGNREAAMEKLLRRLTTVSKNQVNNYLLLLKLGPAAQKVLAQVSQSDTKDRFPTSAQLQLARAKAQYGNAIDDLRAARLILDNPNKQFEVAASGTRAGALSRAGVAAALQEALVVKGTISPTDARRVAVAAKVNAVLAAVANLKRATRHFTPPLAKADFLRDAVQVMRDRGGESPDRIREKIGEGLRGLQAFHENVVVESLEPDRLEKPEGAPSFSEQIQNYRKRFSNKERYSFVQVLAATSDDGGRVLSAHEIVKALAERGVQIESTAVGVFVHHIRNDLKGSNLRIDEHNVRRKTVGEGTRRIVPAWRLAWTDDYIETL